MYKHPGKEKYLDGRSLPQTNRITKIRMRTSFLGVNLNEAEVFPNAIDEVVQTEVCYINGPINVVLQKMLT